MLRPRSNLFFSSVTKCYCYLTSLNQPSFFTPTFQLEQQFLHLKSRKRKKMSKMKLTEHLWTDTRKMSTASLYHPFVLKIAQGNLSKKKFETFMAQDKYFLQVMKSVTAKIKTKCDPNDSETQCVISELSSGFENEEKNLHDSVLDHYENSLWVNPAARRYTEYLKHVCSLEKDAGYIFAAIAPCPLLYNYIGIKIAERSPFLSDPTFDQDLKDWISLYCSNEMSTSCENIIRMVNKYGCELSYERILHYYKQSMILEYMFFDAFDVSNESCLPFVESNRSDIMFFLDFDGTITKDNSCAILGEIAVNHDNKGAKKRLSAKEWNELVNCYMSGYNTVFAEAKKAKSIELCMELLDKYEVRKMKELTQKSTLAGISLKDIETAANFVTTQDGFKDFLKKSSTRENVKFEILSACWSQRFIEVVLEKSSSEIESKPKFNFTGNELEFDAEFLSTGVITGRICGPVEKANRVKAARSAGRKVIYVADSVLDILALLSADLGILFGESKSVKEMCQLFNIKLLPLSSYLINPYAESPTLYVTDSFYEITYFMYGVDKDDLIFSMYPPSTVPRILTVGGSDSGGASGIQADIRTCEANGTYCMTSITSLTSQNTIKVEDITNVQARVVERQMMSILMDHGSSVVKTGMLPTTEIASAVADVIDKFRIPYLVVDPVLVSSTGKCLVSDGVVDTLVTKLLPLTYIITPNISEASTLLKRQNVESIEDMRQAAKDIQALGPKWVLIKGGHLKEQSASVCDVLYSGLKDTYWEFRNAKIYSFNARGTGCTLASAIASNLAKNVSTVNAVQNAIRYVNDVLRHSTAYKIGRGLSGPMCHSMDVQSWVIKPDRLASQLSLYLVTDQSMIEQRGTTIESAVEEAIYGGVSIVQVRCKSESTRRFCELVERSLKVCRKHNVPLIVNDRIDIAIACDADGIHIGQDDLSLEYVRRAVGPSKIIGVSVTSPHEAIEAERLGANYVSGGAIFATATKSDATVTGIDMLENIVKSVSVPVIAIGGIDKTNAMTVMNTGVDGLAVISAILKAPSIEPAARELRNIVDGAKAEKDFRVEPVNNLNAASRLDVVLKRCLIATNEVFSNDANAKSILLKAIEKGMTMLQVEGSHLNDEEFCKFARMLTSLGKDLGIPVIIIDRLDITLICQANGVHLHRSGIDVKTARKLLGPTSIVGSDVKSVEEAQTDANDGVDYICITESTDVSLLKEIVASIEIPVVLNTSDEKGIADIGATGIITYF